METKRILVIGETCKDVFIYGESNRLSPEAPVPVFIPKYRKENRGMAENVINNLKSMSKNMYIDFFTQNQEITKTRYIDDKSNHMFMRIDEGEDMVDRINLTSDLLRYFSSFDVIIVSDYNKGFLTEVDLIKIGGLNGLKIIDTKRKISQVVLDFFDIIKLNEHEYKTNYSVLSGSLPKVIVTLGIRGAMYKDITYEPVSPKETIDVSGAGDTFLAAFTLKYIDTYSIKDSIEYANEMSSIVISKRGVATPF